MTYNEVEALKKAWADRLVDAKCYAMGKIQSVEEMNKQWAAHGDQMDVMKDLKDLIARLDELRAEIVRLLQERAPYPKIPEPIAPDHLLDPQMRALWDSLPGTLRRGYDYSLASLAHSEAEVGKPINRVIGGEPKK